MTSDSSPSGADRTHIAEAVGRDLAPVGALYYFDPTVLTWAKGEGVDGFRMYFLGRGGVLGNVEAPVIQSAFGYFEPGLVDKIWNSARERMDPGRAARHCLDLAYDIGRNKFDGLELGEFNAAADALMGGVELAGLTLFSGYAAAAAPADVLGRAMHHAIVLRELRGSAHLLAVVAAGLTPREAHAVQRPDDSQMFGWSEDFTPSAGAAERLGEAEAMTNRLMVSQMAHLTDAQCVALETGAAALFSTLG